MCAHSQLAAISKKLHGNAKSKSATVSMAVFTPSLLTGNLATHGGTNWPARRTLSEFLASELPLAAGFY